MTIWRQEMKINTDTKLLGLLGYPLGQSLSSPMQNMAFKECSLNKIYIPIEVLPENLDAVVKGISKMNFDGFNITKPYKVDIIKYLDEIDEYAMCIGAVNTVTIKDGRLKGYNTDGTGFLKSFEEDTGVKIQGKKVFILGSGGAARAIGMTLALNKAEEIYICNRTYNKAQFLSDEINKTVSNCSKAVHMIHEDMEEYIKDSDILINCTSIGMLPNVDETPLEKSLLHKNLIVCDIVYNPRKTKLILDAEDIGCKTVPGMAMLVYQGAEAFELWTGAKAPLETMFRAVDEGLNS
ncbi:MAG TPA: shikimate dehydrogenase [Clostridiales bacterium]|nr:shikimate dehydrogenase [Clostridiales bacterium]